MVALLAATWVVAGGLSVLVGGWWLGMDVLRGGGPGAPTMKANSALGFVLAGMALGVLRRETRSPGVRRWGRAAGGLTALIGLLTLVQFLGGWDLGIDNLLVRHPPDSLGVLPPGQMSAASAIGFLFAGLSLVFLDVTVRGGIDLGQATVTVPLAMAYFEVTRYLYEATAFFAVGPLGLMALSTATGFLVLGIGVVCARPRTGWLSLVRKDTAGGVILRRLLPAILIGLPLLGWVRLLAQRAGYFGTEAGLSLMVVVTVVLTTALALWSAASLNRKEASLRESNSRFATLLESAPEAIFVQTGGRFAYVNAAAVRFFGAQRVEDLLGKPVVERFHPDHRAQVRDRIRRLNEAREVVPALDEMCLTLGGVVRDANISAVPFTLDGQSGALVFVRDITERKRAEEATRRTAALLAHAGRMAQLGAWEVEFVGPDYEAKALRWSDEVYRLFGYQPGEVPVSHALFFEHVHPDDRERVRAVARAARQGGGRYEVEHRIRRRDGTERVVVEQAEILGEGQGGRRLMIGAVQDITERKRAEERLRKLVCAVEQAPVAIVIADRSGNIEFANPHFVQVSGYSLDEVVGKSPRILKSGSMAPENYRQLWETITAGGVWRGIFHNRRKDGTLFWETATIAPLRNDAGEITHFVAVKEDVTEKRLMEAKLLRAQRVESIGSLASGIAHDLNNILTPILLCAPMLRLEDSAEGRAELVETIESSAGRAVGIVRQLLQFARGKEGQRASLQVRHLVREVVQIVRETFPRNIQIRESCPQDLWPVVADATQLHQVLLNLCVNARDAMPSGGTLSVGAANVVFDEHYAAMHPGAATGPYVCLRVSDTGVGMDEYVQRHLFDTFFTTKGESAGTGLGLTTAQGIVRDHGGRIRFTSQVGQGTTFEIHLPAAPDQSITAAVDSSWEILPRGEGEVILVVDDEVPICEATRRTLERHGYQVHHAHDGIEALAIFSTHLHDVRAVVTDYMMPRMDGLTLCRAVQALAPGVPVIVSSGGLFGDSGNEVAGAFRALGVAGILHKPHTAEPLLRALAEALGKGASGNPGEPPAVSGDALPEPAGEPGE